MGVLPQLFQREVYDGDVYDYMKKSKPTGDTLEVKVICLNGQVCADIRREETGTLTSEFIPYERLHLMIVHGLLRLQREAAFNGRGPDRATAREIP